MREKPVPFSVLQRSCTAGAKDLRTTGRWCTLDDDYWAESQNLVFRSWSLPFQRGELIRLIDTWILLAGVRPVLEWEGSRAPILTFGFALSCPLIGALALQLLSAVGQREGWLICANCKTVFFPERCPSPGRRYFCEQCRESGAPTRLAMRDYRERMKSTGDC
jgi:hypothetical protein